MPELVVTAVLVEGRSKSEVARDYGLSRRWVITLVQRYLAEGASGLRARSRRPHRSPRQTPRDVEDEVVRIREDLHKHGHEAGADTIRTHLLREHGAAPAVSTIWRILTARGFVTTQPHKQPKSSYLRSDAEQPNERWQTDITHWTLADDTDVEIPHWLDDHSRLLLANDRSGTEELPPSNRTISGHLLTSVPGRVQPDFALVLQRSHGGYWMRVQPRWRAARSSTCSTVCWEGQT